MNPTLNRKGITPIISVILLLMMVIAIAGIAYTWLQGMQETIQTSTANSSERLLGEMNVQLRIDGVGVDATVDVGGGICNATVYFRNKGTEKAQNLRLFVDDVYATDATAQVSTLNPGTSAYFNASNSTKLEDITNNSYHKFKVASDETEAEEIAKVLCS